MNKIFMICSVSCLLATGVPTLAATTVDIGCKKLRLTFAPNINSSVVDRDWESGATHNEAPAVLELLGCKGELLDHAALAAPLARIDPAPLRGAPAPTYLVSADLTAIAGSYNGPLTVLYQVQGNHFQQVSAREGNGEARPISLARTGKASWERRSRPNDDIILSVNSHLTDKDFVTDYKNYSPTRNGWTMRERSEGGLWESDGDFPDHQKFPK